MIYLMRILLLTVVLSLAGQLTLQAQEEKTNMDSLSYSLGVLVAQNLKSQGFEDLDATVMASAIQDVLTGQDLKMDVQQANAEVQAYMQAKQAEQFAENKEAGEAFLKENALRGNVVTTESGLQYEVLHPGSGAKPGATSNVTVHYHGTTIDGNVFDSSVNRGTPASFGLNQVIKGWTEGLQLMSTGAKYRFFIPSNLAYGEQSPSQAIKPYSTLIFDVELIKIN
jgi:FKBP-type peptidyl-prolyl cis-trans isomerase FklB